MTNKTSAWSTTDQISIGISGCLMGEEVRFDGGHKHDRFLTETVGAFVSFIKVCPEVDVGMGVPRPTVRLVQEAGEIRMIAPKTDVDWTGAIATLNVAHQVRGYVLTDRATLIAMGDDIDLDVLVEDTQHLANPYGVIPVRAPSASAERQPLAEPLATWLMGPEARALISGFRIDGQALFHPSAASP